MLVPSTEAQNSWFVPKEFSAACARARFKHRCPSKTTVIFGGNGVEIQDEDMTIIYSGVRYERPLALYSVPIAALAIGGEVKIGSGVATVGGAVVPCELYDGSSKILPSEQHSLPPMEHIISMLPASESIFCTSGGEFTVASGQMAAFTKKNAVAPSAQHTSIIIPAECAEMAVAMMSPNKFSLALDTLSLSAANWVAMIPHSKDLGAQDSTPLRELSEKIGRKIQVEGGSPQRMLCGEPAIISGDGQTMTIECYGQKGQFHTREESSFYFAIPDASPLKMFADAGKFEIFVPPTTTFPVGFRCGAAWLWSMCANIR